MANNILTPDFCVVGAGAGGLSFAAGAAQLGLKVVLVEAGKMGGDCLNYGCVPSKSLIAAGQVAAMQQHSRILGVHFRKPLIHFNQVHEHVHQVINSIAPHDSQQRFESLGCVVIRNSARFINHSTIQAGEHIIRAKRFIIATGSQPRIPDVKGLDTVNYLTNETIFDLDHLPEHLIVLGGGPIGCELSMAFAQLGAQVSMVQRHHILPKDDPDAVAIIRQQLLQAGITLYENSQVKQVSNVAKPIEVTLNQGCIRGSHLLVATGRKPSLDTLNLSAANVNTEAHGIVVNHKLRTSNPKIYAIGDVTGAMAFTHVASYHASLLIKHLIFRLPVKARYNTIPRVTYTAPELAHVGTPTHEVDKGDVITQLNLNEIDRARAQGIEMGFIKVRSDRRGYIKGVTIVAPHGGDLIQTWVLAMEQKLKLSAIAGSVAAYPTLSEINKRVAGQFYTDKLFGKTTRLVVRLLHWLT